MKTKFLFLFFVLFFLSNPSQLFSQVIVIDENSPKEINVASQSEFYVDPNRSLGINQLPTSFTKLVETPLDFGFTKDRIWLRFQIRNLTQNNLFLSFDNRLTDYVKIYIQSDHTDSPRFVSGSKIPYKNRPVISPIPEFKLTPTDGDVQILMSIESSDEIVGKLVLRQESEYREVIKCDAVSYGFYYGVMTLLFFCFLFRYHKSNGRHYLFFSFCVFGLFNWILSHSGHMNYIIHMEGPFIFMNVYPWNFFLAHALFVWFLCKKEFNLKPRSRKASRFLNVFEFLIFAFAAIKSIHYHT